MASTSYSRPRSSDARVLDYLDDKLQSETDFDTLDSLLDSVRAQQDLLKKQLADAKAEQESTRREAEQHATAVREQAEAFQKEQASIDSRLQVITQSETSDEAVQSFESTTAQLHKLDVASNYAEMLIEVDALSNESASMLGKSDASVLKSYKRLQDLAHNLGPLQEAAEGAAPHLVDHVASSVQGLRNQIEKAFAADFEKTLIKIAWPRSGTVMPPNLQAEWHTNVGRLLDLQKTDLIARHEANKSKTAKDEPVVLLPLEVMVRALQLRFDYHFSGDRPTNRLDKPEYFFSHVLDLFSTYDEFFRNSLQPELLSHFRDSELAFVPGYIDATSAMITAMLPLLERKLLKVLPQVASQPQLFSNLMHEIMIFDTTVLGEWNYTPLSPTTAWRGLAYYILEKQSYFSRWMAVERDFALGRYEAIIADRSSGELDFDSVPDNSTKPTKAAIRVNDLLETITDRYRSLSSFSQKLRFLLDIQISIFDRFHQRLHESLEAYLTRTSTVARTVHGVTREDQAELAGVKGLDRLCRVFGSAEYLEKAMRDWSDDVFFLELWEELQYRASTNVPIRGDLRMSDIALKTNSSINGTADENDELEGALFDETAASYQRLRLRSEGIIKDTIVYHVRDALRPYGRINPWASLTDSATGETALTAELDPPLRLIGDYLAFLARALGSAPLRRVGRHLALGVQTTIWDNVLLRHSFSTVGATQLKADFQGICSVFDKYLGADAGRTGMKRLSEGLALLSLPSRGDKILDDGEMTSNGEEKKTWNLQEVERRIFMDNESARDMLEEMGLETLSENDARAMLRNRVELSND